MHTPSQLFVYGTLRVAAAHPMGDLLRAHADLVGTGSIRARLYIIDDPDAPGQNSDPGALPSGHPQDQVTGEVYTLRDPDAVLPAFDEYEACSPRWPEPHEFLRRPVTVALQDGRLIQAISYLYTWDVSDAQHVASGNYLTLSPKVR